MDTRREYEIIQIMPAERNLKAHVFLRDGNEAYLDVIGWAFCNVYEVDDDEKKFLQFQAVFALAPDLYGCIYLIQEIYLIGEINKIKFVRE
jgi:glutaredoxin-related protein